MIDMVEGADVNQRKTTPPGVKIQERFPELPPTSNKA